MFLYQTKCDTCQTQEYEGCKENIDGTFTMDEIEELLNLEGESINGKEN